MSEAGETPQAIVENPTSKSLLSKMRVVKDVMFRGRAQSPLDYEAMVEKYDNRSAQARLVADLIRRHIPIEGVSRRVLDVAAGTGIVSRTLADAGYEVTATDVDEQVLDFLHEQDPDITIQQADMNKGLPGEDNTYDAITSVWGNRFISDTNNFLAETKRVLKPGGVFVWPIFPIEGPMWKMKNGVRQHVTADSLRRDVLNAGFSNVEVVKLSVREAKADKIPLRLIPQYIVAKK